MADTHSHIVVDRTHLGRRASGLERITCDLFSNEALAPLPVQGTAQGGGRLATLVRQMVLNPLAAALSPGSLWVFSGFPPARPFGAFAADRGILYVHDLFLIERSADLNAAGRFYMAPSFRAALRSFRWFLANSVTTAERLTSHVDEDARIGLYRPPARDVLALSHLPARRDSEAAIRIGMIGTVEPRKNYRAAVPIRAALEAALGRPVALDIVGRPGWGPDAAALAATPRVRLHGFVDDARIASLVAGWDVFLSTSHDEGLGLPLLEVQHAGLPVVVPDGPVFREVLAESGTYIDPARPDEAAAAIAGVLAGERARHAAAARRNIARWNRLAAGDRVDVIALLTARLASLQRRRAFA